MLWMGVQHHDWRQVRLDLPFHRECSENYHPVIRHHKRGIKVVEVQEVGCPEACHHCHHHHHHLRLHCHHQMDLPYQCAGMG